MDKMPGLHKERRAFEAWMRGHCWALSARWYKTGYASKRERDSGGDCLCPLAAATRQLFAAWLERAAQTAHAVTSSTCATAGRASAHVQAPSVEDAYDMGAAGARFNDDVAAAERACFEDWMRRQGLPLGAMWTGGGSSAGYWSRHEAAHRNRYVCPRAMRTRRLWAAWRDRAALAHASGTASDTCAAADRTGAPGATTSGSP